MPNEFSFTFLIINGIFLICTKSKINYYHHIMKIKSRFNYFYLNSITSI